MKQFAHHAHLWIVKCNGIPGCATDAIGRLHAGDDHSLDAHSPEKGEEQHALTPGVLAPAGSSKLFAQGRVIWQPARVSQVPEDVGPAASPQIPNLLQDTVQLGVKECGKASLDDNPLAWPHLQAGH